ncbi:JmjC domain-containing protein [Nonomuraea sp. NPDC051941]|uniref:JmjC domain-containing protein n=1 Tax=Nonomuraea sp. NPDC051941 TaxID=3364373 RepID=UPI0037C7EC28
MLSLADLVGDEFPARRAVFRSGAVPDPGEIASVADIDRVLTGSGLRAPGIRVVKDGSVLPSAHYTSPSTFGYAGLDDVVDPGKVVGLYREGATLVLGTVNLLLPRLHELCKTVERDVGHPVDANVYVAPPGARAFDVHCDAQDIIVIQAHGAKQWTLFDDIVPNPGGGKLVAPEGDGSTYELCAGDVLHVPRGMPHLVRTAASASVHVTISVNTLTWADLLKGFVTDLLRSDEYAAALPMGVGLAERVQPMVGQYADRLAAALTEAATAPAVHEMIYGRTAFGEAHQGGLFSQALLGAPIGPSDRISLRPGTWPLVGEARIKAGHRTFRVPDAVAAACELLMSGPVKVGELSGDPGEAVKIAQALVELGLCAPPAP